MAAVAVCPEYRVVGIRWLGIDFRSAENMGCGVKYKYYKRPPGWVVCQTGLLDRICVTDSESDAMLITNILNGLTNDEWIKHLNRVVKAGDRKARAAWKKERAA